MPDRIALDLGDVAASNQTLPARAEAMLVELQRSIPFDSAWVALADPLGLDYSSLAVLALDRRIDDYLSGPINARDIESVGANRMQPPLSPSDLAFPAAEIRTWAECLLPAGYHEALTVSLFAPGHRHIGLVALLSGGSAPPSEAVRDRLDRLSPILAEGLDPMRSVLAVARLVEHAIAGVLLVGDHQVARLPGFVDDPLLASGSALLAVARRVVRDGRLHATFLWPGGAERAHRGYVRVTTLTGPDLLDTGFGGIALLSPAGPLRGLTPRELEVLGLIVEGCSNQEIADGLVVAPRTVAAHLEHILAKLDAPSRTLAAVRAERVGLYVPSAAGGR